MQLYQSMVITERAGEWIQIDLDIPTRVVAVVTQGRSERDHRVTSYKIQYGNCTDDLQTVQRNNSDEVEIATANYKKWKI